MSGMALDEVLIHLWMQRCLGGRELEDEPAVAHVDAGEAENVAEERSIRLRILRVEEYMCAGNHARQPSKRAGSTWGHYTKRQKSYASAPRRAQQLPPQCISR